MKKIYFCLLPLLFMALGLQGQDQWSGQAAIAIGMPYVDLNSTDYTGYKPNLGVTAGLGYQWKPYLKVRGDVLGGQLNGNGPDTYYITQLYEGSLSLELNLLQLSNSSSNLKINILGGLGASLLNTNLYRRTDRSKITEVPAISQDKPYSTDFFGLAGLNVGIPLNESMDLNAGYAHRIFLDQPWIDATNTGTTDSYGMITVGLTFQLTKPIGEGNMEIDKRRYRELQQKEQALKEVKEEDSKQAERIARLEMSNQEKEMQVAMLKQKVDSMKANPAPAQKTANRSSDEGISISRPSGSSATASNQYRVIIGSLPTRAKAEAFIRKSSLDQSGMMVAEVPELNTFRVIYKSSSSIDEARRFRDEAQGAYPDAWIIKF